MLEEMSDFSRRGESFAFETTLSGLSYRKRIRRWRDEGYLISLLFLALPTVETAIARVAERVKQGGHAVAESVIRRRFVAGLRNFEEIYKNEVHSWIEFDNSGVEPVVIAWGENG
jgi:predicted ABC-type ATPase